MSQPPDSKIRGRFTGYAARDIAVLTPHTDRSGPSWNETKIQEVISAILHRYGEQEQAVTDASAELHGLCGYLEFLLQFDQKDRRRFLGPRKDYWDFLSVALQRNGGDLEVIRLVYSLDKLKTTVGRGRAFIRFCLAHNQLADTLQLCLLDPELNREWYGNQSPFLCPELNNGILEALYFLNGVTFDLELQRCDLDGGWPMFSESRCQDFSLTQEKLRTKRSQEKEIQVTHLKNKGVQSKKTATLFAVHDLQHQGDYPKEVCLNLKECLQKAEEQSQKKEKLLMTLEEKVRELQEQLFRCQEQQTQLKIELEQRQQEAEKREDQYQQELKEQHELVQAMKRRMVELIQEKDSLWQKTELLSSLAPGLCAVCSKIFGRLSRRYKCRICGGLICHACSVDYKKKERCCRPCHQKGET
ncbi:RUN and FYVE domain-containing protein 4 [Antechinus flavipes]|uniref:RUN and FYVE domain-containing protein 4 n=1 Tax=Antechinus flavipes TaxID=38775 RepID=UPI002236ABAB|nr:RUN and FYVE domain-containing protein 4 [Antechinus flavipes]